MGPSGFEPESPAPQAGRISCGRDDRVPAPKPSYPTDPRGVAYGVMAKNLFLASVLADLSHGFDDEQEDSGPAEEGRKQEAEEDGQEAGHQERGPILNPAMRSSCAASNHRWRQVRFEALP